MSPTDTAEGEIPAPAHWSEKPEDRHLAASQLLIRRLPPLFFFSFFSPSFHSLSLSLYSAVSQSVPLPSLLTQRLSGISREKTWTGGKKQRWRDAWAWHHSLNKAKLLWAQCTETLDVLDLQLIMSALYFLLRYIYRECICRWSFYTRWVYKIWHSAYVGSSFDVLRLSNNVRTVRCDSLDNNLTLCHIII